MALPKTKKKIVPDVTSAVKRAAETSNPLSTPSSPPDKGQVNRGGRPSPRNGKSVRQTLLLSEGTAERLTMAYAGEQIKRRKSGKKLDKSLFIEEMVVAWLDENDY